MIEELRARAAAHLPLPIASAEWTDPELVLAGDGWGLTVASPWRVARHGTLLFSWSSEGADDLIWDLVGHTITAITAQSTTAATDPALILTGGLVLEVFSDVAVDPWVLRLPGITYVGSPTDPSLLPDAPTSSS